MDGSPDVIAAPYQVRDRLQPESSLFICFWTPGPAPDTDPGFAGGDDLGYPIALTLATRASIYSPSGRRGFGFGLPILLNTPLEGLAWPHTQALTFTPIVPKTQRDMDMGKNGGDIFFLYLSDHFYYSS
jgi:hypothetical protein